MKITVKKEFLKRMEQLLKEEYEDFLKEYDKKPQKGLRVNTLKIGVEEFKKIVPFEITPIPWCPTGFYYDKEEKAGNHLYHILGLYYIQEPTAMAVVEVLDPKPGEKILDVSAAPGGKTTHIATKIGDEGIIVANEIDKKRIKALVENVERMGIRNIVITNETPEKLATAFEGYFDKILVDAPCSGEGMFRKDPTARKIWSLNNVISCSITQRNILRSVAPLLKKGGILVYSTCTFAPEEDEGVIKKFLEEHPEFEIEESEISKFFDIGHPEWVEGPEDLKKCMRLWPHKVRGEGHFIAKLRKKEEEEPDSRFKKTKGRRKQKELQLFYDFADKYLNLDLDNLNIEVHNDSVYHVPEGLPDLNNIKVYRYGWQLGVLKKNRFEPSHWLAMGIKTFQAKRLLELEREQKEKYLKGETFELDLEDGWIFFTIEGFPAGWGRIAKGVVKNYYPKWLRDIEAWGE
ncbi:16S rRNA (cytosine(967)-C(5))-methyltransferase [Thermoanaerobacter uzonensis DSM 18761]|uniref:16S rRNA (Cytosine(967)-C(5))-methyltransferase n=1 Tax=Thermoanaerobacter uzonensis DSM 18761 TaxID=1123369 RepID=A0A1M4W1L2_9THEO|nr:RsmF rRNA methyltransferase first C-terminal domain-containing protein [Thermoanaerobacter uzonensis]SHE74842.1 16S rRNA (cytosine(967)-C(5))-methyltransferase [Thermoanaerobacter uzonensis DSM 18761]